VQAAVGSEPLGRICSGWVPWPMVDTS
jgi:hypothetical protein